MTRKIFLYMFVLMGALSLALGACTQGPEAAPAALEESLQPIVLTDGLGRSVTLEAPAARVVSMAPSNTEILFAIGAGDQVVGRDEFSDYPEEAQALPTVGGSFGNYNNEVIMSLEPDLVLAAEINTPEQVQALQDLGATVFLLPNPTDLEGIYQNLITVGRLTGREEQAGQLAESLGERAEAVTAKTQAIEERPTVFYELDFSDPNAPFTAGPGTFIDLLINMAGGQNAAAMLDTPWAQMSMEEILVQDPQVILLGDAAYGITVESVVQRPGWDTMEAVKNGQVYPFDDNLVSRPSPRLVEGLEELAKLLHPDVFNP